MVVWLVPVGGVVGVVVLVVVGVGVLPRPRHALAALAAVAAGRGHAASCRVQGDEAVFPKNISLRYLGSSVAMRRCTAPPPPPWRGPGWRAATRGARRWSSPRARPWRPWRPWRGWRCWRRSPGTRRPSPRGTSSWPGSRCPGSRAGPARSKP